MHRMSQYLQISKALPAFIHRSPMLNKYFRNINIVFMRAVDSVEKPDIFIIFAFG